MWWKTGDGKKVGLCGAQSSLWETATWACLGLLKLDSELPILRAVMVSSGFVMCCVWLFKVGMKRREIRLSRYYINFSAEAANPLTWLKQLAWSARPCLAPPWPRSDEFGINTTLSSRKFCPVTVGNFPATWILWPCNIFPYVLGLLIVVLDSTAYLGSYMGVEYILASGNIWTSFSTFNTSLHWTIQYFSPLLLLAPAGCHIANLILNTLYPSSSRESPESGVLGRFSVMTMSQEESPITIPPHPLGVKPSGNSYAATSNARHASGEFQRLPDEALALFLEYLDSSTLVTLGSTCKALYAFCRSDELWKSLFTG